MGSFFTNKNNSSVAFTHIYQGVSKDELLNLIDKSLASEGYKKDTSANELIYVKGSRVKRLLLGAFAKYFKYKVIVLPEGGEGHLSVLVSSVSSGMSGGLIGVNQINKETKRLNMLFQGI